MRQLNESTHIPEPVPEPVPVSASAHITFAGILGVQAIASAVTVIAVIALRLFSPEAFAFVSGLLG
jgi:hypothetical protein